MYSSGTADGWRPARIDPVAIAYSFFVEHYVAGLTGSVKG